MDGRTQDVVERMGLFFERDGLSRIAGRLLGHLLLSETPRSLDELAEALQVSKSSVSINVRLLERMGTVERVTIPGDRRDYYRIAADLPRRVSGMWRERLATAHDLLEDALDTPAAETSAVRRRLVRGAALVEGLAEALEDAMDGPGGVGSGSRRDGSGTVA
ncbi:MAG: GbsR/MarR family transcriptional regulator [Candidatus Longimicrobiales bacterium M2_2A_002]